MVWPQTNALKLKTYYNLFFSINIIFSSSNLGNFSCGNPNEYPLVLNPRIRYFDQEDVEFVGRQNELDTVKTNWKTQGSKFLITGLDGIGKSTFATEVLKKFCGEMNIFWLNAETRDKLESSFLNLKERIEKVTKINITKGEMKEQILEIYKCLDPDSVMVFDNTDLSLNGQEFKEYLPHCLKSKIISDVQVKDYKLPTVIVISIEKGFIIIPGFKEIPLDSLEPSDMITLCNRELAGIQGIVNSEVENLSKTLNMYPLAVIQACAYIRYQQGIITINDFLEDYDRNFRVLEEIENRKERTVSSVFRVIFEKVKSEALPVLHLLAFCDPDGTSKSFVSAIFDRKLLANLARFSIINSHGNDCLRVHRVAQKIIQEYLLKAENSKHIITCLRNSLSVCHEKFFKEIDIVWTTAMGKILAKQLNEIFNEEIFIEFLVTCVSNKNFELCEKVTQFYVKLLREPKYDWLLRTKLDSAESLWGALWYLFSDDLKKLTLKFRSVFQSHGKNLEYMVLDTLIMTNEVDLKTSTSFDIAMEDVSSYLTVKIMHLEKMREKYVKKFQNSQYEYEKYLASLHRASADDSNSTLFTQRIKILRDQI